MTDDPRDFDREPSPADDERRLSERLRRLDAALSKARPTDGRTGPTPPASGSNAQGFARALRLSSEFIAGILVGGGVGWALDRALGTSPWALIVFFLLGFVAGVLNVMRAAGLASGPPTAGGASGRKARD